MLDLSYNAIDRQISAKRLHMCGQSIHAVNGQEGQVTSQPHPQGPGGASASTCLPQSQRFAWWNPRCRALMSSGRWGGAQSCQRMMSGVALVQPRLWWLWNLQKQHQILKRQTSLQKVGFEPLCPAGCCRHCCPTLALLTQRHPSPARPGWQQQKLAWALPLAGCCCLQPYPSQCLWTQRHSSLVLLWLEQWEMRRLGQPQMMAGACAGALASELAQRQSLAETFALRQSHQMLPSCCCHAFAFPAST